MDLQRYKTLILRLENVHMNTKMVCTNSRCKNSESCTHDISLGFLATFNDEIRGLFGKVRRLTHNSRLLGRLTSIDPSHINEIDLLITYLNKYARVCQCNCSCRLAGECDYLSTFNDSCNCVAGNVCHRFGHCDRCSDPHFRFHSEMGIEVHPTRIDWECDCLCECKARYKLLYNSYKYTTPCCDKLTHMHISYPTFIAYTTDKLVEACKALNLVLARIVESSDDEVMRTFKPDSIEKELYETRKKCYCGTDCYEEEEYEKYEKYEDSIKGLETMSDGIDSTLVYRESSKRNHLARLEKGRKE